MTIEPMIQQTRAEMLAESYILYRNAADRLIITINALSDLETADGKAATSALRDLRQALQVATDERNNVEKIGKSLAAAAGASGDGYDLDSARDEIGRRLSLLRAARSDGRVSGQPE